MTAWIRSDKFSAKKCPVYYPRPHWCLLKKIEHDEARGISRWDYLEHFLSNITFNDAKKWFENSKYNTNNKEV